MAKSSSATGYQVVARRFRPTTFEEIVGQEAVLKTLRSAIASGRVPHAFLFSGSRGVGKTTTARVLARALNCEAGKGPTPEPCGKCGACVSILEGKHPDVVEIDAASHNLVDDIRELRDRVGFASMGARYKVYILDEVHMLTRSAFNAFLKTLEEPPDGVVFIMATTELHKVPDTIRSRCQVQLFRRVDQCDVTDRLREICKAEKVALPDDVLGEIATSCRGGMRDAETALERVLPVAAELGEAFDLVAYRELVDRAGWDAILDVVGALVRGEVEPALRFAAEVIEGGADEREALGEILDALRSVLLLKVAGPDTDLVSHAGATRDRLLALGEPAAPERIEAMMQAGLNGRERIRRLEDRRLVLELTLLRMAEAGSLPLLGELLAAARSGAAAPATGAPATGAAPAGAPPTTAGGPAPAAKRAAGGGGDMHGKMLAQLREPKPLLARTLEECDVLGPDGDNVVRVVLRSKLKLYRDRLATDGVKRDLQAALTAVAGPDARLVIGAAEQPAGAAPAAPAGKPKPDRAPQPGVQKVIDAFDGQIVEHEERDR